MRNGRVSTILVMCSFAWGGCALVYQYDGYEPSGTGGAGANGGQGQGGIAGEGPGSGGNGGEAAGGVGGQGGGECHVDYAEVCDLPCTPSECLSTQWAKRMGTAGDEQAARSVAVAENGDIVVAGTYTKASFPFGAHPLPADTGSLEGFIGILDATGDSKWSQKLSAQLTSDPPRAALSVATTPTSIFLAGYLYPQGAPEQDALVIRYDRNNLNAMGAMSHSIGGAGLDEAVAVSADGTNGYVVGRASAMGVKPPFNCSGMVVDLVDGMFVMKLNAFGGCEWFNMYPGADVRPAAISATQADTQGIWFTGTFRGSLSLGGPPLEGNQEYDSMFLVKIDPNGGLVASFEYGGTVAGARVSANALDVSPAGAVYVAGMLSGSTEIAPLRDPESAAFVAEFAADGTAPKWSMLYEGGNPLGNQGARATGVVIDDTDLFLAGVFSGTMQYPSGKGSASLDETAGATPFVARIDRINQKTLAIDPFPGGGESFAAANVHMAKNPQAGGVVLAGGWRYTLDFSTPGMPAVLEAPPSNTNSDIFIVKLAP